MWKYIFLSRDTMKMYDIVLTISFAFAEVPVYFTLQ